MINIFKVPIKTTPFSCTRLLVKLMIFSSKRDETTHDPTIKIPKILQQKSPHKQINTYYQNANPTLYAVILKRRGKENIECFSIFQRIIPFTKNNNFHLLMQQQQQKKKNHLYMALGGPP